MALAVILLPQLACLTLSSVPICPIRHKGPLHYSVNPATYALPIGITSTGWYGGVVENDDMLRISRISMKGKIVVF